MNPQAGITGYLAAILICIVVMADKEPLYAWVESWSIEAGTNLQEFMFHPIDATGCPRVHRDDKGKPIILDPCKSFEPR
jgi:hypothetical protein